MSNISLQERCLITTFNYFFSFLFPLKEIKNLSTAEEEATPTRSVPLPMEEEKEGGMVAVARVVDVVAMPTTSP